MSSRPSVKPRQVIKILNRKGFEYIRQSGSHASYRRDQPRATVTIPMHNRDIPLGTLRDILAGAGIDEDEFYSLL